MYIKQSTTAALITIIITLFLGNGCATYVTPGGGVEFSTLSDKDINELMSIQAAAKFPASLAIARVQASDYQSHSNSSYGTGRYSVVTTRDVEQEADFERIGKMPSVVGVAPLNRLLLPAKLDSLKSLRNAAARLKADIILLYTFDTSFRVGAQKFRPLNVISLGFLNNKDVTVTTTASAAFFDVRTEYLFGAAEASVSEKKRASVWSSNDVVDDLRIIAERNAFQALLPEIEKTWTGITRSYHQ